MPGVGPLYDVSVLVGGSPATFTLARWSYDPPLVTAITTATDNTATPLTLIQQIHDTDHLQGPEQGPRGPQGYRAQTARLHSTNNR